MRNAGNAEQIEVGWWPGDARYPRAAFFAYAHPAPAGFEHATLQPAAAHWDATLGEFILDWDDIRDERGSARRRPRLRALGRAARLRGLRLGSRRCSAADAPPVD